MVSLTSQLIAPSSSRRISKRDRQAADAGAIALPGRQLVGEDRHEHQVVDAEHDLQHHQGQESHPGGGVGKPVECEHGSAPRAPGSSLQVALHYTGQPSRRPDKWALRRAARDGASLAATPVTVGAHAASRRVTHHARIARYVNTAADVFAAPAAATAGHRACRPPGLGEAVGLLALYFGLQLLVAACVGHVAGLLRRLAHRVSPRRRAASRVARAWCSRRTGRSGPAHRLSPRPR